MNGVMIIAKSAGIHAEAAVMAALLSKPSPYLTTWLSRFEVPSHAAVIDVPCGRGRNAIWLASLDLNVTAIDIDPDRVASTISANPPDLTRSIVGLVADAHVTLPLAADTFDLCVVVHPQSLDIIEAVTPIIRPGGVLIFETFGGQGENWRALPKSGELRSRVQTTFTLRDYRERAVGPEAEGAVAVKFCGRKF